MSFNLATYLRPEVTAPAVASLYPTGVAEHMKERVPLNLVSTTNGKIRFDFPLDPVVSVQGKTIITRRNVAKGGTIHGTIKESWREDDWTVSIAAVLTYDTADELNNSIGALRQLCESGETLNVENQWLNTAFGITRLVVESLDFQHTKGLNNQTVTLTCYSDDSYTLLEEI
ncbi:MAG: hypothetical protein J6X62_06575 [Bacteroidales bacterium]|nr:hypothetical protein [Bacteroidales bacterium]